MPSVSSASVFPRPFYNQSIKPRPECFQFLLCYLHHNTIHVLAVSFVALWHCDAQDTTFFFFCIVFNPLQLGTSNLARSFAFDDFRSVGIIANK